MEGRQGANTDMTDRLAPNDIPSGPLFAPTIFEGEAVAYNGSGSLANLIVA